MENNKRQGWKMFDDRNGHPVSNHSGEIWSINDIKSLDDTSNIETCVHGYHMSPTITEALDYVQGVWLAQVEAWGDEHIAKDKSAHRSMKILKIYKLDEDVVTKIINAIVTAFITVYGIDVDIDNYETWSNWRYCDYSDIKYECYRVLNHLHFDKNTSTIHSLTNRITNEYQSKLSNEMVSKIIEEHLPEETTELPIVPIVTSAGYYEDEHGNVIKVHYLENRNNGDWYSTYYKIEPVEHVGFVNEDGNPSDVWGSNKLPIGKIVKKVSAVQGEVTFEKGIHE